MTWMLPLAGPTRWPDAPGLFGALRKHDIHAGIDLYACEGTLVVAAESGVVVVIEDYTGKAAGTPWWNDTMGVYVEGNSGVLVYGEITNVMVEVGDHVSAGEAIGTVTPVLKYDKGRPTSMLHFEQHVAGTRSTTEWTSARPATLKDPTTKLYSAWLASNYNAGYAHTTGFEIKALIADGQEVWFPAKMHPQWETEKSPIGLAMAQYLEYCQSEIISNGCLRSNNGSGLLWCSEVVGVRRRVS